MKDRVVQYPHRYQLVPVAGESDTYDIIAKPGTITEAGTPLNKATLLSDATAALYGLTGDDATVDKALSASAYKVGDIIITCRNDLDDSWKLCDGSAFRSSEYPELAEIAPDFTNSIINADAVGNRFGLDWSKVQIDGDKYYAEFGNYSALLVSNSEATGGLSSAGWNLIYTDDDFKTIKTQFLYNKSGSAYNSAFLFAVDEVFVIVFIHAGSGTTKGQIELVSLDPSTDILTKQIKYINYGFSKIFDLWKENGRYYLAGTGSMSAGSQNANNCILCESTSLGGTWTGQSISSNRACTDFVRLNGKYIFVRTQNTIISFAVSDDLVNWQISADINGGTNTTFFPQLHFFNGMYLFGMRTTVSPYDTYVYYTDNLLSTPSSRPLGFSVTAFPGTVVRGKMYWFIRGVYSANSPWTSYFEYISFEDITNYAEPLVKTTLANPFPSFTGGAIYSVIPGQSNWLYIHAESNTNSPNKFYRMPICGVPKIDAGGARAYIKAKREVE